MEIKDISIRQMQSSEYTMLEDFLYNAIFIPQGATPPSRDIIYKDELQVYIKDFGKQKDDKALVAEVNGKVVGAVWSRIMIDYGHLDDETPSLAISLYEEYRGYGIGTALTERMISLLKADGYRRVSLSVQKANYAVKLYKKVGFAVIDENAEEYLMALDLNA